MRVLIYVLEVAAVVVVAWLAYRLVAAALEDRRERRALVAARWRRRVVPAPEGKVRVEVAKHGVAEAITVDTLDPTAEGFELARFEAEARADDLAASLNASDAG